MTKHTFRFGRPTFKHTIMIDGWGTTWLAQVAEKWHNELVGGCKGSLATDWEPSSKKQYPRDIIHKMVGTTKCKGCLGHTHLTRRQKSNMSSTPYPWPSPWFLWALDEAPPSLRNPWLFQPLVGNELPHLKGVSTALYYRSCSHPLDPE